MTATSDHVVMSKSPNKHNRLYMQVQLGWGWLAWLSLVVVLHRSCVQGLQAAVLSCHLHLQRMLPHRYSPHTHTHTAHAP